MNKRTGPAAKRRKKDTAKLNEEENMRYRTKTLSFDGTRHLVHLNLNYIIGHNFKRDENNEDIKDQLNLAKTWPFDVKKITDRLNNLQIISRIKYELLNEDETKDSYNDLEVCTNQDPIEDKFENIRNASCLDMEQSIIRRLAHQKLNPDQRRFLKNLIDLKSPSLMRSAASFISAKVFCTLLKTGRLIAIKQ